MDIEDVRTRAQEFRRVLARTKRESGSPDFSWYPYDSFTNFDGLVQLLSGNSRQLFGNGDGLTVADIGAGDGDISFFLETLGYEVDIFDHAPTNYNRLRGAHALKDALKSHVNIYDVDLDTQFRLPREHYDIVLCLGILYHLKNPYYALETLARVARNCLLSTRIARFMGKPRRDVTDIPIAYLLDDREANNDATNHWIFSDAGLRRILSRTGWRVVDYVTVGNTVASDPSTSEGDERAFCFVTSTVCGR